MISVACRQCPGGGSECVMVRVRVRVKGAAPPSLPPGHAALPNTHMPAHQLCLLGPTQDTPGPHQDDVRPAAPARQRFVPALHVEARQVAPPLLLLLQLVLHLGPAVRRGGTQGGYAVRREGR